MNPEDDKLKPMGTQSKETMDLAADTAKHAIHSTQQAADHAMSKASDKVDEVHGQLKPVMDNMSDAVTSATEKARVALQGASAQLRTQARVASDMAVAYTKDEPLKAMLIAAATGAFLMGLITMAMSSRD